MPRISNDVAAQLRTEFAPRRDELMAEAAKLYAARFSEQELKDMAAFYKSPLGKKMIVQEPLVLDETFNYVQQWAPRVGEEVDEPLPRRDEEEGPQSLGLALAPTMADFDTDLFVIGGGSGGVRAARIAAGYGARVMLAEEYRVGGTCVIRGCVPKKLLVYASRFGHEFEKAAGYGWTVGRALVRLGDADRQQGQRDRAARSRLYGEPHARERDDRTRPARCWRTRTRCACSPTTGACAPSIS